MTGQSFSYTSSEAPYTSQLASDIKDDEGGFLAGVSTFYAVATVLIVALVFFLIVELAWRNRRQKRPHDRATTSLPSDESRRATEGETST